MYRTKRSERDAEDYASSLSSLEDELQSAKDEYENCIQFPDTFDLYGDQCESFRYDYNSKTDEYNSEIFNFNGEFNDLVKRVKNAISYCQ